MSRLLLVEDHERLAQLVCKGLEAAGIAVDVIDCMDAALAAIHNVPYRALIVDRGLPDGEGLALLRHVRSIGIGTPCLILTARDALHDCVEGLEAGADDICPSPLRWTRWWHACMLCCAVRWSAVRWNRTMAI